MVVAVVLCRSSGEQHTATTLIDFPNGAGLGLGGGIVGRVHTFSVLRIHIFD